MSMFLPCREREVRFEDVLVFWGFTQGGTSRLRFPCHIPEEQQLYFEVHQHVQLRVHS